MILASNSPRRKEILEKFGFKLIVKSENVDEKSDKIEITEKIKDIALKKTLAVAEKNRGEFVVGADTVVEFKGEIIGKPSSETEAYMILKKLSGNSHNVITAYVIINMEKNVLIKDVSVTEVVFQELTEDTIKWYIETKEPFDKAGAYGIQGKGAVLVEKIVGDFYTVMGFPINQFIKSLRNLGITLEQMNNI